jgi:hypothetical protein
MFALIMQGACSTPILSKFSKMQSMIQNRQIYSHHEATRVILYVNSYRIQDRKSVHHLANVIRYF